MKNVEDIYPLTPTQAGMLFHCIKDEHSGLYINQFICTISGRLNPADFRAAWDRAVAHFPVLRTAFVWESMEEPLQIVRQSVPLKWDQADWQNVSQSEARQKLDAYLIEKRRSGFQLNTAPLMQFSLFQISRDKWQFTWTCHHLLLDGWTMHMVLNNVFDGYEAISNGQDFTFPSTPPFSKYIAWLQNQDKDAANTFWKNNLHGFNAPSSIMAISETNNREGSAEFSHFLSEKQTEALSNFAKENRLTLNTLIQAAWAFLLSVYSGKKDVVFGATLSGRPATLPGIESLAGMCINTLPVRIKIDGKLTLKDWLSKIQKNFSAVRNYEYSSLVDVMARSELIPGQPLFDNILVFENYPLQQQSKDRSISITDRVFIEKSNFPLAVLAIPSQALQFMIIYDRALFSDKTIKNMTAHLQAVLLNIIENHLMPVAQLSLLGQEEKETTGYAPVEITPVETRKTLIHERIESFAHISPDATAVVCLNEKISFNELNERANQLAHYLRGLGVGANDPVGIFLERSVDAIITILAVLKSGAAYVPLDPSYPTERISFMMGDAQCPVLVSNNQLSDQLTDYKGTLFSLTKEAGNLKNQPKENLGVSISHDDLAYIIYTSGSTGKPKGVMVTQGNLAYSTQARFNYYKEPVSCFLLLSSFSFDSSVAGLFWTLGQGGKLVLPAPGQFNDPEHLASLIAAENVSHLLTIPSLYTLLLDFYPQKLSELKTVIVAGEVCPSKLIDNHQKILKTAHLFNEYGPTEATVWGAVFNCADNFTGPSVPIGKAIPGTQVYILDERMHLVPDGIRGEIYLAGGGICKGYLNQPELTAQRFIDNPFSAAYGPYLYKTGDIARRLKNGNIEFIGRNDQQIKLRGFRVELGEIENTLTAHPQVREAVVFLKNKNTTNHDHMDINRLADELTSLDDLIAESLLNETLQLNDTNGPPQAILRAVENDDITLKLEIKNPNYIAPPRDAQRQWLVSQVFNEFRDDLNYLDQVAKTFVPGTSADVKFNISESQMSADRIMEDWQIPIMKAMAKKVADGHGDVLEIGFGRGVSATFIQELGVKSHTIVEMNQACIKDHFIPWQKYYANKNIQLVQGRWQHVLSQLSTYDGIFFHAFPMDEEEFLEAVVHSITFAEHFFRFAAKLLKKGGVFTYLTTEIDSLSRRHQRALFKYFSEISLSVQPIEIPEDTIDTWWADKMVIIKAVK